MKSLRLVFWILLYAAFVAVACGLRGFVSAQGLSEVWGWDYQTFVGQIQDWRWIGYFGFRHPGLGLVMSPLVALEHLWSGAYLLVMPALATATAALIWKMSGWRGLFVWLTFPTTWLMAGIPESFPLAQLALVGSVWISSRVEVKRCRGACCVGFVVLNTMITLTNGVKPVIAYLVMCRDWKKVLRIACAGVALLALGVVFFYVRSLVTGRGIGAGIGATLSWIPSHRNITQESYGFFIKPVGLIQSFFVYPAVLFGIYRHIRRRQTSSLILLASYFIVDMFIHLGIGWGMSEPWVFAPHWIWMLPMIIRRSNPSIHEKLSLS